jgi:LPS O-antigen subunit length determinant protein (WzzB/FepE family)
MKNSSNDCFKKGSQKLQYAATIAHAAKIVATVIRGKIEGKIEDVLAEEEFRFRGGKGTRNSNGMQRKISE